jgi:hypothetical protein
VAGRHNKRNVQNKRNARRKSTSRRKQNKHLLQRVCKWHGHMVEAQLTSANVPVVDAHNRRHTDVTARRSQVNLFGRVSIGESKGGEGG